MNKLGVRDNLKTVITEMLLSNLESGDTIPQSLSNYILGINGWSTSSYEYQEDVSDFVEKLKQEIEKKFSSTNRSEKPKPVDYDLSEVYQNYIKCENEYCRTSMELIEALEEAIVEKEKYSEVFKHECLSQSESMELLAVKEKILELQLFMKLYGEKNALVGHLSLQSKLKKELEHVKRKYKEAVELSEEYDKIKSDKTFCELFRKFKELKKIKERSELVKQL